MKKLTSRKSLSLLISLALLVAMVPSVQVLATGQSSTKPYIVVTADEAALQSIERKIGGSALEGNEALTQNDMLLAELTDKEAKSLAKDSNVLFVEEDFEIESNSINNGNQDKSGYMPDGVGTDEWNMQMVNANAINEDIPATNISKIKVAVLDSGVDMVNGIELADSINLVPEEQYISPLFVDMSGHGTAIASIIAGNHENEVQGVNPNVELYSVKVMDGDNKAPVSRIIEGIYWCIDNDIKIINMSFGTSKYSKALQKAVEDAYDAGILMIAASGNNAAAVEYPAAFPEVMAVAAIGTDAQITDFSNTGEELEIAAPGEKIKALGFFGGQIVTHGTSIAVPHVTGAASLLWQKDPTKSNEFIRQLLACSAKDIQNSDECGLLDVTFALEMYDDFAANWIGGMIARPERLPENGAVPETFEEINDDANYAEGLWYASGHNDISAYATSGLGFTATEIAIIKKGATYPDDVNSGVKGFEDYPEWHGYYTYYGADVNYIACYFFVSAIAKQAGDVSSFASVSSIPGISSDCFNWIKSCFSSTGFGFGTKVPYSTILSNWSYSSQNTATQKNYRKAFIYGMAMHIMTDTFAHSAYAKPDSSAIGSDLSQLVRITHNGATLPGDADDPSVVKQRYAVAKDSAYCSLFNYAGNYNADWGDYAINGLSSRTFMLANAFQYAQATGCPSSWQVFWDFCNIEILPDNRFLPIGCFDSLTANSGSITVAGWAIDDDVPTASLVVHVYIGGPAGTSGAECHGIVANGYRPDVGAVYPGRGDYHGFHQIISTSKRGVQDVYVYVINIDKYGNYSGGNPCIGSKTVTIPN